MLSFDVNFDYLKSNSMGDFCVARLDSGYDKAPLIKKKRRILCTFFKQRNWLVDMIFWDIWLVDQTRDSPFMKRDPPFMQVLPDIAALQGTQLLWKRTHLLCKGLTFYEKGPTFYASSLQGTQLLWKGTHLLCKFSRTSPLLCLHWKGTHLLWRGTHLLWSPTATQLATPGIDSVLFEWPECFGNYPP